MNVSMQKLPRMWAGLGAGGLLALLATAAANAQTAAADAATAVTDLASAAAGTAAAVASSTVAAAGTAATAAAATPVKIDSGDTAWVLVSTALVFLMTAPGLALFYGGLVRKKNVLSVFMQCMMIMSLISLQWVFFGYSLAFGPDHGTVIGGLDWAFLKNVGQTAGPYADTIPHLAFMMFQMMFAVITPALIIGAFAERVRFAGFCVFMVAWATVVYDPVCHWVWGHNGFLANLGALDFAGGTVVHITAGVSALAFALFLGKRKGYPDKMSPPHNLPFAVIGTGLLWFGWYGFNAGSALETSKDGLASAAFMNTHVATAIAGLTWAIMDWIFNGKPTVLGICSGAVAGLVAITPASGFVDLYGALAVGIGAGILPWIMVSKVKPMLGYDDTLDAFGVHGIGGTWGALATGLFATKAVNPSGNDGLFYGNAHQLVVQIEAVAVSWIFSFVVTMILLFVINLVLKLRASEHEETVGLDLTQHKETGYTVID